jgi:hypothetical protein
MKPTSDGLDTNGLKFLAWCSINANRASTLVLSSSFIKIFYLWIKDRPRCMISVSLSGNTFLMHILFRVFQIAQANPTKHESPVWKLVPNLSGNQTVISSVKDLGYPFHPNASLQKAHTNSARRHLKNRWSASSTCPHNTQETTLPIPSF